MTNYVLDTGALVALERRKQRMVAIVRAARTEGRELIAPGMCVAEWWRGRTDAREQILEWVIVEHTDDDLVKLTGEALAAIRGATCVDALVMATAARHGALVLTSDLEDLQRLQSFFPSVRLLST